MIYLYFELAIFEPLRNSINLELDQKVSYGWYWCLSFLIANNWYQYFCITQTTADSQYSPFFLQYVYVSMNETIAQVTIMKEQIVIVISWEQAMLHYN